MSELVVLDIDGVLADVRHRLGFVSTKPKNWDAFFNAASGDEVLPEGLALAQSAATKGQVVCYLTGRPERCRADTLGWLAQHGFPNGELHMRQDHDRRPARLHKRAILSLLSQSHDIALFVDDDASVVQLIREAGFNVLHATWMGGGTDGVDGPIDNQRPPQDVLFEVQEQEGRS